MIEIEGKYTNALVYTNKIEDSALEQIQIVCNQKIFENSDIRIMPDVHAGAGCVIGFTAKLHNDFVIPNLIGVDIGCGILNKTLNKPILSLEAWFQDVDKNCHRIPHGFYKHNKLNENLRNKYEFLFDEIERINKDVLKGDSYKDYLSLGSLGGGNHFIEISIDNLDNYMLHIHSGSRNFGHRIATHYQKMANETCLDDIPKDLKYLSGNHAQDYIRDMKIAQLFAKVNREIISSHFDCNENDTFDTVHNYISDDNIIRKGAVSAQENERFIVPLNMRDGSLICEGLGNKDFNYSSPHGAGRLYSRTKAKSNITLKEFEESMKDVYTTCVNDKTIDESPMAYKNKEDIIEYLEETATIINHVKPVYNFKAN